MCMSSPKTYTPPPPPAPPPPPVQTADKAENKSLKRRQQSSRRRGVSALTIRRPSVNVGSSGTGANISY